MNTPRYSEAPRWWVPGDWNGFFGLFTNVALNVIVLTGLCLGVVKLPADIVFGRILPALGIALPLGNLFYAWLACQLAKQEGRNNVTALPYGPCVPHMFIVVFVVMLPTYLKTNDPVLAWEAGLAWAFVIGVHHPARRLRRPDGAQIHAARGDARRARRHLDRVHLDAPGVSQSWQVPWLSSMSLAIILVSWMARRAAAVRHSRRAGGGAGRHGARLDRDVHGDQPVMDPARGRRGTRASSALHLPIPSTRFPARRSRDIGPLLVTAVPLGIYNFTEGMNNVESAAAAGDEYNLRKVLIADGIGAIAGRGARLARFRRRSISAIPAGNRSADGSAIRWRPASSSGSSASSG